MIMHRKIAVSQAESETKTSGSSEPTSTLPSVCVVPGIMNLIVYSRHMNLIKSITWLT